jgi:large subunit ribosomal protein L23
MRPEDIIIAPVITEKSNDGMQEGKYTFKVNKKATKVDIANAVEKLFEVKVLKVNTVSVKGKMKRMGKYEGKTSDWKKAIVTIDTNPSEKTYLAKGGKETKMSKKYKDSIDEFMGA